MNKTTLQTTFENQATPRQGWESEFTSPADSSPDKFCLLVHGLPDAMRKMMYHMELATKGSYNAQHNIDLAAQPWRVCEKTVLSTSIITENSRGTYGDMGLILKAPFENIIDMSTSDLGTNLFDPAQAAAKKTGSACYTPRDLARLTHEHSYNEVSLRGTSEASAIEVVGIFVKVDENGEPQGLFKDDAKKLAAWGLKNDCPVISVLSERLSPADIQAGFHDPQFIKDAAAENERFKIFDEAFIKKAALFGGGDLSDIDPASTDLQRFYRCP